jgi:hypothetical protein
LLAESPNAILSIEGFDGFVASTAAPIATGWSDPIAGRDLHPLEHNTFHGALRNAGYPHLSDSNQATVGLAPQPTSCCGTLGVRRPLLARRGPFAPLCFPSPSAVFRMPIMACQSNRTTLRDRRVARPFARFGMRASSRGTGGIPASRSAFARRAFFAIAALVAGFAIAAGRRAAVAEATTATAPPMQPAAARTPVTPRHIAWWVRCLGDRSYKIREAASRALTEAGPPAKAELLKALNDPDAEIRRRARTILGDVLELDFRARLEAFVADTKGVGHHDLPGWERFRRLLGQDAEARQLFAEMQRAEPGLFEAAEAGPEYVDDAVQARCLQMQQAMQIPGLAARQRPSVGSVAAILFVAADDEVPLSQQVVAYVNSFSYQQPFQQAINGGEKALLLRKLLGGWVRRSLAIDRTTSYQSLLLALRYDLKEGVQPALEALKDAKLPPNMRQYPILLIGKLGGPRHVAALAPLLNDTAVCITQRFNNNTQVDTQVRDVALAVLVRLTGQDLKDYGFRRAQETRIMYLNPASLGFGTQAERDAALKKWHDWVEVQRQRAQKLQAQKPEAQKLGAQIK